MFSSLALSENKARSLFSIALYLAVCRAVAPFERPARETQEECEVASANRGDALTAIEREKKGTVAVSFLPLSCAFVCSLVT